MRVILIAVIAYLVIRYLLRPILMAAVVKSAGKMMQDMQNRSQENGPNHQDQTKTRDDSKKSGKDIAGEYIDYEEVK